MSACYRPGLPPVLSQLSFTIKVHHSCLSSHDRTTHEALTYMTEIEPGVWPHRAFVALRHLRRTAHSYWCYAIELLCCWNWCH